MCSEETCKVCKWKESCVNNQEKPPCYKPKEAAPVNPYIPIIIYPQPQIPPLNPYPWNPSPWINPITDPWITWTISTDMITYDPSNTLQ
jgi:hypothetical protein